MHGEGTVKSGRQIAKRSVRALTQTLHQLDRAMPERLAQRPPVRGTCPAGLRDTRKARAGFCKRRRDSVWRAQQQSRQQVYDMDSLGEPLFVRTDG